MPTPAPHNRRRRKRITEALVFLAAGAAVTIGAAWLLALFAATQSMWGQSVFNATPQHPDPASAGFTGPITQEWPLPVPREWPTPKFICWSHTRGLEWVGGTIESNHFPIPIPVHGAVAVRTGWPFYALEWRQVALLDENGEASTILTADWAGGIRLPASYGHITAGGSLAGTVERRLPTIPLFPGFLLDAAIYGAALWTVTLGPPRLRRAVITRRRDRRGQCRSCGYPMSAAPVCTECGRAFAHVPPIVLHDRCGNPGHPIARATDDPECGGG